MSSSSMSPTMKAAISRLKEGTLWCREYVEWGEAQKSGYSDRYFWHPGGKACRRDLALRLIETVARPIQHDLFGSQPTQWARVIDE